MAQSSNNPTTPFILTPNNSPTQTDNSAFLQAQQSTALTQTQAPVQVSQSLVIVITQQLTQPTPTDTPSTDARAIRDTASPSPQSETTPRASRASDLLLVPGDLYLPTEEKKDDKGDETPMPDRSVFPERLPPQQQAPDKPDQSNDGEQLPPLQSEDGEDEPVTTATSDAAFSTWEGHMTTVDHDEVQTPVAATREETPNWSLAGLGLIVGSAWVTRLDRSRAERKRVPAWPRPE